MNYNSKDYWDGRYSKDRTEKKENKESTVKTYEWYLKFEDFSHLLRRDIGTYFPDLSLEDLSIYIPGCGNSTLAEDLYDVGESFYSSIF